MCEQLSTYEEVKTGSVFDVRSVGVEGKTFLARTCLSREGSAVIRGFVPHVQGLITD